MSGSLCTRLTSEASLNPPRPSHEWALPNNNTSTITISQPPQSDMVSKMEALTLQENSRWTFIPESRRAATLSALTLSCHSYSTLADNKYISGPGYSKILGVEVPLSLIPIPTPAPDPQVPKLSAVALDCEMVGIGRGISELARISAVDALTSKILIDTLVQPTQPVKDWRTKFSGITKQAMTTAVAENRVLKGWPEARSELWKYIDSNTIIIGQSLNHDFDTLRMQHWVVVDSGLLAKNAIGPGVNRQWGLKALCDQSLGIAIQDHQKQGHDSIEDAFAAREVVLWCIGHKEELAAWGRKQKEEYIRKKKLQEAKRAKRLKQKKAMADRPPTFSTDDEVDEIVRWSDIAEDLGWPHPDTGYDPWSD